MSFKVYAALGGGAKGICYWQYRAERVGMENDCAGIASPDGTLRDVAYAVKDFGGALKKHAAYFENTTVEKSDIAVLFDYNCSLMSLVEDNCGDLYDFKQKDALNYYRRSLVGFYRMLKENDYPVDFVRTAKLDEILDYKAIYLPYYCMINEKTAKILNDYVKNGGVLIADEGFGLRTENTWLQPYDVDFKPAITARATRRRQTQSTVIYGEKSFSAAPYRTDYAADGETVARFDDDKPAARKIPYGKGFVYLFGFSLGVKKYSYACAKKAFFQQNLLFDGGVVNVLLNASQNPFTITAENVYALGDGITSDGNKLTIPPETATYVIRK